MEDQFFVTIYHTEWGSIFSVSPGNKISHDDFLLFVGRIPEIFPENKLLMRRVDFALYFVTETGSVVRNIIKDASTRGIGLNYQEYMK